ncbi:PhzF family phenazine biosynthesis protein [Marinobacter sp. PE14]
MKCRLVDVFASQKFRGNGLTIFYDFESLNDEKMLVLTQEMRQFESIFLSGGPGNWSARIFTMEEELEFAGHPLLGLAYHLHQLHGSATESREWQVALNGREVALSSRWEEGGAFRASMSQGKPEHLKTLSHDEAAGFYKALSLSPEAGMPYPAEVITTGLPYLILPVNGHLDAIKFNVPDLSSLLASYGAKFIYVLDTGTAEGRTWDNAGKVEDIATGSAAGPAAVYLFWQGLMQVNPITIFQGRFCGRPSEIEVLLEFDGPTISNVDVSGNVVDVADIRFSS